MFDKSESVEVVPAILVKRREEMLRRIELVMPYVKRVHIDMMDGVFVPNSTVWVDGLESLPRKILYEFHWMVQHPENYVGRFHGLHKVHVEVVDKEKWEQIKERVNGRLGIAVNPETDLRAIEQYVEDVDVILIMGVKPGFDGQEYMKEVEDKIREAKKYKKEIQIDGGINLETARSAIAAGADTIISSSFIFSFDDVKNAIKELRALS